MYDWIFYLFIWGAVGLIALPIVFTGITTVAVKSNRVRKQKRKETETLENLRNIDFLLNSISKPKLTSGELQTALDAFYKFHAAMGDLLPTSEALYPKLDFVAKVAVLELLSIDDVSRMRDQLTAQNKHLKKEIEQTVGKALQTREKNKKGKK